MQLNLRRDSFMYKYLNITDSLSYQRNTDTCSIGQLFIFSTLVWVVIFLVSLIAIALMGNVLAWVGWCIANLTFIRPSEGAFVGIALIFVGLFISAGVYFSQKYADRNINFTIPKVIKAKMDKVCIPVRIQDDLESDDEDGKEFDF